MAGGKDTRDAVNLLFLVFLFHFFRFNDELENLARLSFPLLLFASYASLMP